MPKFSAVVRGAAPLSNRGIQRGAYPPSGTPLCILLVGKGAEKKAQFLGEHPCNENIPQNVLNYYRKGESGGKKRGGGQTRENTGLSGKGLRKK